jgi:hypothetical protein
MTLLRIIILAFGVAIMAFGLHGCPGSAWALGGSAPITVTNGDVGITVPTCAAGEFVSYNGSAFSCSAPAGTSTIWKRTSSDKTVAEADSASDLTGLTGWTLTKEKYYLFGGQLRYTPATAGTDCPVGFLIALTTSDGTVAVTANSTVFMNISCVAGVNKSDAIFAGATGAGTSSNFACDLGTTEDVVMTVSGMAYLTDGGSGSDFTQGALSMRVEGAATGTGVRTCVWKTNSQMWFKEVSGS